MGQREYCRYVRTYSELEGLQRAHTMWYSASVEEEGILMELRLQQDGKSSIRQVICPQGEFRRSMLLMRYLCENGVGFEHWLDVLDDLGVGYLPVDEVENTAEIPKRPVKSARFVAFAGF